MALGASRALFPREVCDNTAEVNAWLCTKPERFREATEDGVWQGAASALAVVHFRFPGLVDIHEVAGGFTAGIDPNDLAFHMPRLEDATDAVLAIAPLEDLLCSPCRTVEEWRPRLAPPLFL